MDAYAALDNTIAKYGGSVAPVYHGNNGYAAPVAAPKANFMGDLGNSIVNGAGGLVKGIVGAAVSPFLHIGNDLLTSAKVNNEAGKQDAQRSQIMASMKNLRTSYQAGSISNADYQKGLKGLGDQLNAHSQKIKDLAAPIANQNLGSEAMDVGQAAGTVLTMGAGGLEKGAAEAALTPELSTATKLAAMRAGIGKVVGKGIDQTIGSGESVGNNIVTQTAGKLVRNAAVTQPTIQSAVDTGGDIKSGNYKQAAINAGLLIGIPALAGAAPTIMKIAGKGVKSVFGQASFLHDIPTTEGASGSIPKYVAANADKVIGSNGETVGDVAKTMQQYNLNQTGMKAGDILNQDAHNNASQFYQEWLGGKGSANMTPAEHIQAFQNMTEAVNKVRQDALDGTLLKPDGSKYSADEVKNLWVGRFSNTDRTAIVNHLDQAGNGAARVAAIDELAQQSPWGQNENLVAQLKTAAQSDNYRGEINALNPTQDIRDLGVNKGPDGSTPYVANQPAGEGAAAFDKAVGTPTTPEPITMHDTTQANPAGDYNGYVPIQRASGTEIPTVGQSADLVVGHDGTALGRGLTKIGLSPYSTPTGAIATAVRTNMDAALADHESAVLNGQGSKVFNTLMAKADGVHGVYDPRMLTHGQVLDALGNGATVQDATDVMKSLRSAYADVPASTAGAGNWLTAKVLRDAPFMNQYLKIQGIAKFSANPFFYLKQLSKSGIIAVLQGADHIGMSSETEQALRGAGVFSKLGSDLGGADSLGSEATLGKGASNDMKGPIKAIVGGLAESIAASHGMTVAEALKDPEIGQSLTDNLRVVTGYPRGGYINSPLAKSLNIILFPSRFETKVVMAVGHAFASQPPVVQAAMVAGVANMTTFLKSPQGVQWQKDNSEALGLLKYFTPLSTIANVNSFLSNGHHIADLGELGGLPFGVISTILQHQGIPGNPIAQSTYTDPKTGAVVPEKVPITAWGHTQQALIDLVSSTFSFPGKQAGFSVSKTSLTTSIPGLAQSKSDYKTVTPPGPADESKAPSMTPVDFQAGQPNGGISKPVNMTTPRQTEPHIPEQPSTLKPRAVSKSKRTVPLSEQIQH